MSDSLALNLFDAYAANAGKTGHLPFGADAIECPLCLVNPIPRAYVAERRVALEHIIPQHSTADSVQVKPETQIGVKNVRSGLTLTCAECNAWKGKRLDWPLRNRIASGNFLAQAYPPITGTSILTYAYLLGFAIFGYQYIHKPEMVGIRDQFKSPNEYKTRFLNFAEVRLEEPLQPIVCNEFGYPCVFKITRHDPLEIFFWRFRAVLPSLDGVTVAVDLPQSLIALAKAE